jgi:hypothetical protein
MRFRVHRRRANVRGDFTGAPREIQSAEASLGSVEEIKGEMRHCARPAPKDFLSIALGVRWHTQAAPA